MKQSDIVTEPNRTFSTGLSAAYKDVFDGAQTTVDIADLPYKTGLFFEVPTATTPNYGSGEVVGYKLGLYVNSILQNGNPGLGIWKAKQGITNREGNFGTETAKEIYSMTSFCSNQPSIGWMVDFEGLQHPGTRTITQNTQRKITSGPYCTVDNAWDKWKTKDLSTLTKDGFREKYGKTLSEAFNAPGNTVLGNTKIIPLEKKEDLVGGVEYNGAAFNDNGSSNPLKWTIDSGVDLVSEYHWFIEGGSNTNLDLENSPSFGKVNDSDYDSWVREAYTVNEPIGGADQENFITNLTQNIDIDFALASSQVKLKLDNTVNGGGIPVWKSGFFYSEDDSFSGGRALHLAHECGRNLKYSDVNQNVRPVGDSVASGDVGRYGYQQATCLKKSNISPGIVMTKDPEQTGTEADGSSTSNKVRQSINISLKIRDIPEIVSTGAGAAQALFPSRGLSIWFKNRLSANTGRLHDHEIWNLADDIYYNHYDEDKTQFEAATDGLTGINNSPFCGFVIYKFNNDLYCMSLGAASGSAGWTWTMAEGDIDYSSDSAKTNNRYIRFDADDHGTRIFNNILNKEIVFNMAFNPRGSGFTLNIIEKQTGKLMFTKDCYSTQASASCNTTTSWNHFAMGGYNCATLGTGTGIWNHRPWFPAIGADSLGSEHVLDDNTKTNLDILVDAMWVTKAGFNYKHLNSTFSGNRIGDGIGIHNRDVQDSSATGTVGTNVQTIKDTTGYHPASFLSFGTKTKDEITPSVNGEIKYLYFSNFQPSDPLNVGGAIDNKYMKWSWSTDDVRLGQQLWGYDNSGSVVETGTLGTSMFKLSGGSTNERMYFSSAEIAAEGNSDITQLLSSEHFTQKGHIAYSSVNVSDAASMKNTIVKRENIFCSARVIRGHPSDSQRIFIDDKAILESGVNPSDEEYIVYTQGARNAPTNYKTGVKFNNIQDGLFDFGVGKATELTANCRLRYTDAYTTLVSTPLGVTGGTCTATASSDRLVWTDATHIKLSDGTQVNPLDYFNVGDTIQIGVTGATLACEGIHTIDEVGELFIGISTNLTGDEAISTGTLTIKKTSRDFLLDYGTFTSDPRYDDAQRVFVSPHRYWMFAEIFNYDSNDEQLPDKTYGSCLITDFNPGTGSNSQDFTTNHFGATWSEFSITDAHPNTNSWDLARTATSDGALVLDTDFGYGTYDTELATGGYVQKHAPLLTLAGSPLMNIIDISNIRKHKEYLPSESMYLWINALSLRTSSKVNVSTTKDSSNAKRPFLLTVYEDERPDPPSLSVKPYEEDAFLPQYKWSAKGDDLWYGLLFIDNKNIASQYHNAQWRLHLNEDTTGYASSDFVNLIKMTGSKSTDSAFPTYATMTFTQVEFVASSKKIDFAGLNESGALSAKFKAGDTIRIHHEDDDSSNAQFNKDFTVASVVDGTSGHIIVSETVTDHGPVTTDGNIKNRSQFPEDRYDGLGGNSKYFTSTNKTVLPFDSTSTVKLLPTNPPDKFSVSCHIVGEDVTLSGTNYILYQQAAATAGTFDYAYYIAVNANGNIVVSVQGYNTTDGADTDVVTTLTSASIMPTDGETPMHICFTLDNELAAQNLKLFINGELEASSGIATDSGSDNTSTSWGRDLKLCYNEGALFVGAENQSGENGFDGHIEEIVAYSDVIYPVNPKEGEFLWTKPVEDFTGTADSIAPTSYTARLFIKDFHNIRGSSATDIATSGMVSFRKPVFDVRGA